MSERTVKIRGDETTLRLTRDGDILVVSGESRTHRIEVRSVTGNIAELVVDGRRAVVPFFRRGETIHFHFDGEARMAEVYARRSERQRHREQSLSAPMPGVVLKIFVEEKDEVKKGAPLIVLEAMKMEHQIFAPYEGVVEAIHCEVGELVQPGAELIRIGQEEGE